MTIDKYQGEQVLVVPTLLFHEIGYFQGFSGNSELYLRYLLDGAHTLFMPRSAAEEDPSYKQLIPYCLFRHEGQILNYRRGNGIGEGRLLGKRSVGIGGHISAEDAGGSDHPYQVGMQREIAEEVEIQSPYREALLGLINDDETPVGQVHLGVVHVMDLESPHIAPREASMQDFAFSDLEDLLAREDEFESWSQICLRYLATC